MIELRTKELADFEPPAAAFAEVGIGPDHDVAFEDAAGVDVGVTTGEGEVVADVILAGDGMAGGIVRDGEVAGAGL